MGPRTASWLSRPGLLRSLLAQVRLGIRLVREPRVPLMTKAVPLLAAIYLISPLDAVPDLLPILGQIDDLGLILVALVVFLRLCPATAVAFHRAAIAHGHTYAPMPAADDVIDAEWRHESTERTDDGHRP